MVRETNTVGVMIMAVKKLTAIEVLNITAEGRHSIGNGLFLHVRASGNKTWEFRFQLNKRRRWMGFGRFDRVSNTLADARKKAVMAHSLLAQGIDPISNALNVAAETKAIEIIKESARSRITFRECADRTIQTRRDGWKAEGKSHSQWINTLNKYIMPTLGDMPVADITVADVVKCLNPIWKTKTDTAAKIRQRVEAIIDNAISLGDREKHNPASRKVLDSILPKAGTIIALKHASNGTDGHHAAIPYQDMPAFMAELTKKKGISPLALRFKILTVPRTTELRKAIPSEFDIEKKIWTIPSIRMKALKAHRVALSDAAIELYEKLPKVAGNNHVFPGGKPGECLSSGGMLSTVRVAMNEPLYTPHGVRSSFRDWVGEETNYSERMAEFALSHLISDKAEKAYARSDKLQSRFAMMNDWADYCDTKLDRSDILYFDRRVKN